MKTSFNSIGKAFKKMFSRPKKQTVTPAKDIQEKKKEIVEHREKIPKFSTSAYGIKMQNIYNNKFDCRANKIRRRRMRRKMGRRSRQVNYRIAA